MPPQRPSLLSRLGRAWFPLALVALVILALPGFALFGLNLLGREGAVNRWLEDTFRLSYHLPVPWWAVLLLLLIPLGIILLYFLKLKRRPIQVPSTFLWRKSIEDLHVNSLFQWLRENVLLLLQVLTVLALIYALMAFRLHGRTTEGTRYILMIDNSASMAATDVAPSRLDLAKKEALHAIDSRGDGDVGMVIVFNATAEILQSFTSDKGLLRRAVERIVQTHAPTRIEEALHLADSLANPQRSTENEASRPAAEEPGKERTYVAPEGVRTELHLFSDGRFPDVPGFELGNLDLRYHAIGQSGPDNVDNLGLVTLNALRDERDPGRLQVLATIHNYRSQSVDVRLRLEVRVGDDVRIYDKPNEPLTIPARKVSSGDPDKPETARDTPGDGTILFDLSDLEARDNVVLHARLLDVRDQLALDDQAWLVLGNVRKGRVLIVGTPNEFLHAYFDHPATRRLAEVAYLDPADLTDQAKYRQPALAGHFDLVIFDRCAPESEAELPQANTVFIDAVPPPWKKAELPKLTDPRVRGWLGQHPLLARLSGLHEVRVAEAFRFDLADMRVPPRTPRLLETDRNNALMFALARQAFTDVVMAFALVDDVGLRNTNWITQPTFPIFLFNVLRTLGNAGGGSLEESIQPGQPKALRPDVPVRQIEIVDPAGKAETLDRGSRPEFSYGKTDQVGVYTVRWEGDVRRRFAVNLLDDRESNLQPRDEIHIGTQRIAAGETFEQTRELWKWAAVAALLLLLLEWYVYNRRVYI